MNLGIFRNRTIIAALIGVVLMAAVLATSGVATLVWAQAAGPRPGGPFLPPAPPDLSILKVGVVSGQTVTYTVTVTNIGQAPSSSPITITDTLSTAPTGSTFASASGSGWSCTGPSSGPVAGSSGPITCTYGSPLGAGAPALTLTVVVNVPQGGNIENCASVAQGNTAATVAESSLLNNQSCQVLSVSAPAPPARPDLQITKVVSAISGQTVTYTITVKNIGTGPAAVPITVTDTLNTNSLNVYFTSFGVGCGGPFSGPVTCISNSPLAANGTLTFTLVVTAPQGGGVQNCATTAQGNNAATVAETILTNNTSCVSASVQPPAPTTRPDLSITKVATVSGQTVTYNITVTNYGNASSTSPITVTDTLSSAPFGSFFSFVSNGCSGGGSGPVTCTSNSPLAVNGTLTYTLVVTVPQGGSLQNCASVSQTFNPFAPDESTFANNSACVTTTVQPPTPTTRPDLKVTKVGVVSGQTVTYTIAVTNIGTAPAASPITVTDTLTPGTSGAYFSSVSSGCSGPASGPVTCTYNSSLAPGAPPLLYSIEVTVPQGGNVENCATTAQGSNAATTSEASLTNNTGCVTNTVLPPTPAGRPDLKITKVGVVSGNTVTYTITVTNIGTAPSADPIIVIDTLNQGNFGSSFVSAIGSGWTCSGLSPGPLVNGTMGFNCTHGTLAPGAPALTLTVVVTVIPGYFGNCALVSNGSNASVQADSDLTNNEACVEITMPTPTPAQPDLQITKTGVVSGQITTAGGTVIGQTITYTITVKNIGTAPAAAPITVIDTLTSGTSGATFSSHTNNVVCSGFGSSGPVTCTSNSPLAVNGTLTFTIGVSAPLTGTFQNCATTAQGSTAATVAETALTNNTSCVTNTLVTPTPPGKPDLKITKVGVVSGQTITYTITVTNIGTGTVTSPLYVWDTVNAWPSDASYASYPSPGLYGAGGGGCTTQGPPNYFVCTSTNPLHLAAGGTVTMTFTINVPQGGVVTNCAETGQGQSSTAVAEPNTANNKACVTITVPAPTPPAKPDLQITKVGVVSGNTVTYTITVTNVGDGPAAAPITVTDTLTSGTSGAVFSSSSNGCTGVGSGPITCTSSSPLAPHGALTFTIVVDVRLGGRIENCATVDQGKNVAALADSNPSDNRTCVETTVPSTTTGRPDLSITKVGVVLGQTITYTITVTNIGNTPAAGPITVTDTLAPGSSGGVFSSMAGICSGGTSGPITCTSTTPLNPGAYMTFTIVVTAPLGGSIENCATVDQGKIGAIVADPTPDNNKTCTTANVLLVAGPNTTTITYVYSVKFVCGTAKPLDPVAPGTYYTAINIHNYTDSAVTISTRPVIAWQEDGPRGAIAKPVQTELKPDEARLIGCRDILKSLKSADPSLDETRFFDGLFDIFVEVSYANSFFDIFTELSLDGGVLAPLEVDAVHSMGRTMGTELVGTSMNVLQVQPRIIGVLVGLLLPPVQ